MGAPSLQARRPLLTLRPWAAGLGPQAALHSFRGLPPRSWAPLPPRGRPSGAQAAHPPMPTMHFISTRRGGGAAGIALGLLNPGHSAGSNAALRCVPASLRKTWHLYRPGQPRGRHEGGHTRPIGSMAHGVGASTPPPPRTCSLCMEIAPRCLLPKLVMGQLCGRGVRVDVTPVASSLLLFSLLSSPPSSQTARPLWQIRRHTSSLPKNIPPACPLA